MYSLYMEITSFLSQASNCNGMKQIHGDTKNGKICVTTYIKHIHIWQY